MLALQTITHKLKYLAENKHLCFTLYHHRIIDKMTLCIDNSRSDNLIILAGVMNTRMNWNTYRIWYCIENDVKKLCRFLFWFIFNVCFKLWKLFRFAHVIMKVLYLVFLFRWFSARWSLSLHEPIFPFPGTIDHFFFLWCNKVSVSSYTFNDIISLNISVWVWCKKNNSIF